MAERACGNSLLQEGSMDGNVRELRLLTTTRIRCFVPVLLVARRK